MGGLQGITPVVLSTTDLTDVFEAKSDEIIFAGFGLVNDTGSAVDVSVYTYNGTTDFLYWKGSVAANSPEKETDLPVKFRMGHKVKVQASTGSAITVRPIILRLG
jgi:hypothetical protein